MSTGVRDLVRRTLPVCAVLAFAAGCDGSAAGPDARPRFTIVSGACGEVRFEEMVGTDSASAVGAIEARMAQLFGQGAVMIEPHRLEVVDGKGNAPDARFYALHVLDPETGQHCSIRS